MSNRNLTHYFSPNSVKTMLPAESALECTTPVIDKASKKSKQRAAKEVASEIDDDFENEPILTPQHGNAITKYFSPVDKTVLATKKKKQAKPPIMTVEAQVHGSPSKQNTHIILKFKKVPKKTKKKKIGIPESLADRIELVSSEEVEPVVPAPHQPEVPATPVVLPKENPVQKPKWQLRLRLDDSVNSSDGDFEQGLDAKDGPRRSVRLRSKPPPTPTEPFIEEEPKKVVKKKRKKDDKHGDDEDDIEVLSEDVAPIFLKKQLQDEARAVKKAKQDFLFSGVPEVLKQQTTAQQKLDQRPVEIFPKTSHVTQAGSREWHLPFPDKRLIPIVPERQLAPIQIKKFSSCLSLSYNSLKQPSQEPTRAQIPMLEWRDCKQAICKMKEQLSLSFPFFRTLRNLLPKSSRDNYENMLWTDAYAPKSSLDFLATNRKSANQLKTWLNQWKLRAGEEAPATPKKPKRKSGKRKRIDSNGTDLDDEILVDEKSNSSWSGEERLNTCMLLVGPSGCGKTATVYALAEELGFNVLEVNASSRRNGKTVLSQLHEATQSHSLNSTTPTTSNTLKNFFSGAIKSAPKPEEKRPAMSLALFKDVDIVFETEDESFYGALTTLIQTSKRPIIMTLGTTQERPLTIVQDKIKSFFDVILFASPDISTACGYLWSLSLAKGYPLRWESLQRWVASRAQIDIDLRSLINELQFLLQHHRLGLSLNFTQLQLKGEEESATTEEAKLHVNGIKKSVNVVSQNGAGTLLFIELPISETVDELRMPLAEKPLKFVHDTVEDNIVVTKKAERKFCRILDPEANSDDSDQEIEEKQIEKAAKWDGDLQPLAQLLEFRANNDFVVSDETSWNETSLSSEIKEFSTKKCVKLLEKELDNVQFETRESRAARLQSDESLRSANSVLLNSSIGRVQLLQRRAGNSDVLPYLRSFLRSDVVRSVGKRRRKATAGQSVRLPSLDLVLSTSTVLELANQF